MVWARNMMQVLALGSRLMVAFVHFESRCL